MTGKRINVCAWLILRPGVCRVPNHGVRDGSAARRPDTILALPSHSQSPPDIDTAMSTHGAADGDYDVTKALIISKTLQHNVPNSGLNENIGNLFFFRAILM